MGGGAVERSGGGNKGGGLGGDRGRGSNNIKITHFEFDLCEIFWIKKKCPRQFSFLTSMVI